METTTQIPKATGFGKWLPLMIMSLALMIIVLDTTILNVSLRTIINDLHTNIQSIQWVITAYSLMLAAFTITGGRLGDLFGRKRMFMLGAIIFAIGSFMTSIAHSVAFMIWGEAIIEGVGAALMMPATASLLVANYEGRDRQIGFGIWGGIAAAAAALGPVFGGWLTTAYSWRWAFRINVVVALVLVIGSIIIKESQDTEEKPLIDYFGIVLSSLGLLSMVFGFIKASDYGWFTAKEQLVLFGHTINLGTLSVVPIFILIGLVLLFLFGLWEQHRTTQGKTPLVSLKLFRNQPFTVGASLMSILMLGMSGLSFATPVFLQSVLHLDALHTGLAMLPMSLTLLVGSPLSAYLAKYISPKRLIQIGLVLNTIGFWVLRYNISVTGNMWSLTPGYILFGAGFGFMISQVSNVTLSAVSVQEAGEASGVNGTLRQVGATLGAAVLGSVLISVIASHIVGGINTSQIIPPNLKPQISTAIQSQISNVEFGNGATESSPLPQAIKDEITKISRQATVDASHTTLVVGSIFGFLGIIMSFWLPEGKHVEAVSVAETPIADKPKNYRGRAATAIMIIILGAGTGGYFIGRHNNTAPKTTAVQDTTVSPSVTPTVTPPATTPPPITPTTQNYSDSLMHFAVIVPSTWIIKKTDSHEVQFTTDSNALYSVQVYGTNSNSLSDLKNFLSKQAGISNIQNSTLDNMPVLSFDVSGVYQAGVAFISGGRLYYILGPDVAGQFATFSVH